MADIHIGKITKTGTGRGTVELIYHIPVLIPKGGVVPTPETNLPGLPQAELDALASGRLVEIAASIAVNEGQSQSEILAAIRADWQNIKQSFNQQYDFEYKYYGTTINATA
jgi:hypothetical protein